MWELLKAGAKEEKGSQTEGKGPWVLILGAVKCTARDARVTCPHSSATMNWEELEPGTYLPALSSDLLNCKIGILASPTDSFWEEDWEVTELGAPPVDIAQLVQ